MENSANQHSLAQIASEFVKNITSIFKDTLEIFVLETQLATKSFFSMIVALFLICLFGLTIWISLLVGLGYFFMTIGWQWQWIIVMICGMNLLILIPIIIYAVRAYKNFCFIATRNQLESMSKDLKL